MRVYFAQFRKSLHSPCPSIRSILNYLYITRTVSSPNHGSLWRNATTSAFALPTGWQSRGKENHYNRILVAGNLVIQWSLEYLLYVKYWLSVSVKYHRFIRILKFWFIKQLKVKIKVMLRFWGMMLFLHNYENISSFFSNPRKSWIGHRIPRGISVNVWTLAPSLTFKEPKQSKTNMMDLKEFVKFLKYETDLNRFLDTTAGYCITNRVLPTQYEV